MTANILVIILLVALEAAYIFISLKAIICEKLGVIKNAFLFCGIIAANLGSGILYATPFRFLLVAFLVFGLMKLICREMVYFYSLFLIMAVYAVKYIIEVGGMMLFALGIFEMTPTIMLVFSTIMLVFPILTYKILCKITAFVDKKWHETETFYLRYVLVLGMIAGAYLCILGLLIIANNSMRWLQ